MCQYVSSGAASRAAEGGAEQAVSADGIAVCNKHYEHKFALLQWYIVAAAAAVGIHRLTIHRIVYFRC